MHGWVQAGEIRTIAAARPGLLNKCPCVWLWRVGGCTALPQRFPCCWGSGLELQEPKLQRLGWEWKCCSPRTQLLLLTTNVIRRGSGCFFLVLIVPGNGRVGIHSKALNSKFRTAQRKKGVCVFGESGLHEQALGSRGDCSSASALWGMTTCARFLWEEEGFSLRMETGRKGCVCGVRICSKVFHLVLPLDRSHCWLLSLLPCSPSVAFLSMSSQFSLLPGSVGHFRTELVTFGSWLGGKRVPWNNACISVLLYSSMLVVLNLFGKSSPCFCFPVEVAWGAK